MSFVEKVINKSGKGIPIPITEAMLNELIKNTEKVKVTNLVISHNGIIVTGKAEVDKLFKNKVSFMIVLQPVKVENREIHLKLDKFNPLNLGILNKKLFNNPPYLSYDGKLIKINLNSWEKIKKIPLGKIKSFKLTDGKLILSIGI